MPLANSLQSLSPARADLSGVGQPHGAAPADLCGPRRGEGRGQAAVASEPSPVTRRPARRPRDGGGRWPPDGTLPYARRRPASAPGLGPPPRPPLFTNSLSSLEKEEGDKQRRESSLPPPTKVLYSREATEGKRQGRCPRKDPPSHAGFPRGRRKGGNALCLGLLPKQTATWGRSHPRHGPPGMRGPPRVGDACPGMKRGLEGTRRGHTVPFSPRRWNRRRRQRGGRGETMGTGSRWLRRALGLGAAQRRRLLPPLAGLRSPLPQVTCGRGAAPAASSAPRPAAPRPAPPRPRS